MQDQAANKIRFFAIAGNIGAGKSSLTGLLARHYNWNAVYESVDDNPYLADFYEDMKRWSFNLQIYFLSSRFRHQKQLMLSPESFIQDRTIYEDVEIFAKNLYEMSLMSERDYNNYRALFAEMVSYLKPPDLLIYLRAKVPTLVRQIQKRGRDYENTIRIDYLERLNKHYEDWIERYPYSKLIIETDDLDFVNHPDDLGKIIDMVDNRLFSLFP
ncbi:deoxynucleoside kinase [bacterium]|nr:MAG: deoxynucleoside kinase [bacterium]